MVSLGPPQCRGAITEELKAQADVYSPERLWQERPWHVSCGQTYCVTIETETEFRRLAPLWRALHAADPSPSPFASWEWAWNWWHEFGKPCRDGACASRLLLIAVLTESHELIGLFPFHFPLFGLRRPISPCSLRAFGFLGKHYESMTEAPVFVTKPGSKRRAFESVLHFLLRRQPRAGWDSVEIWAQHSEPFLLAAPLSSCTTWQRHLQHRRASPVMELTLPSSWEKLRASLSKSMRDNLRYYPRLLARHGHSWKVTVAAAPLEVSREAEALIALHRQREAGRPGARPGGHLPAAVHRHFFSSILSAWASQREASVAVLWIDGWRAASQSLLRHGETCVFYYSGFHPAWSAYSPLTILQGEIFASLIQHGISTVNLLAGDEAWKTRWGAKPAGTWQHLFYPNMHPASLARLWLYGHTPRTLRDRVEENVENCDFLFQNPTEREKKCL